MTSEAAELVTFVAEARQLGGAAVGQIEAAGEGSSQLVGRRVIVGPIDPCGQCEICRRGGAAVCPQARPRELVDGRAQISSRWAVVLGDGLELAVPAAAAVGGDVTTAYTLYARTGLSPRDPVVVTGMSAVTRFLVEILRAKGITPTVVGTDPPWCAWLADKGASVAATGAEVIAAVSSQGLGNRPLRVIATDAATLELAASLAGPRATLTVLADRAVPVGFEGRSESTPLHFGGELVMREVTIVGVAGPHPDLMVEAAAMCAKGEIDLAGGVTTTAGDPTRAFVISVPRAR